MNGRNSQLKMAVTIAMPPCLDLLQKVALKTTTNCSSFPAPPVAKPSQHQDKPNPNHCPSTPPLPSPFEEADDAPQSPSSSPLPQGTAIPHGMTTRSPPHSDLSDDSDDGIYIVTSRIRSRRSSKQTQEDQCEFQSTPSVPTTAPSTPAPKPKSKPVPIARSPVDQPPRPASHYFYATSSKIFDAYGHGIHTHEPYDLNDTSTYDFSYPPKDYSPCALTQLYDASLNRARTPLDGLPTGIDRTGRYLVSNQ